MAFCKTVNKSLTELFKKKIQIIKIRNEKGDITMNLREKRSKGNTSKSNRKFPRKTQTDKTYSRIDIWVNQSKQRH